MKNIDNQIITDTCNSSNSMSEAAAKLGLHFNTFKRIAAELNVYKPNKGLKNGSKPKRDGFGKIPLSEILDGKHPQYQTYKLKHQLFRQNIKENKCESCGTETWMNKPIACELDHIDGNRTNHLLANLRILCPNCHSQTETFRSRIRQI
jgi:hypothetical protein